MMNVGVYFVGNAILLFPVRRSGRS